MVAARRPQGPQALGWGKYPAGGPCGRRADKDLFSGGEWTWRAAGSVVFHHRVEDKHQFANAGGHGLRARFAGCPQPQVEVAQRTAAQ